MIHDKKKLDAHDTYYSAFSLCVHLGVSGLVIKKTRTTGLSPITCDEPSKELWIHFSKSCGADPDQRGVELEVLAKLDPIIGGLRSDDMRWTQNDQWWHPWSHQCPRFAADEMGTSNSKRIK